MTAMIVDTHWMRWFKEVPALLRLSIPIMVAQGGLVAMGLVDTFMIGRVSPVEMGAVALGNAITFVFLVFGLGLTMGIEPLAAQADGAGDQNRAYDCFHQGLWMALLTSIPVMLAVWAGLVLLPYVGIKTTVVAATGSYIWFRLPSIPVNAMYGAARSYLTSIQRTRPIVIAVATANVANVGLNYVFLFKLDMGAGGVGAATSICWTLMFVIAGATVIVTRPPGTVAWVKPNAERLRQILHLGWPIGLQMTVEVAVFALVGLLVGRMGEVPLGGHQIAMTLASFTFMGVVGIAVGATTKVGFYVGAGQSDEARQVGLLAILLGGLFMGIGGIIFLVFNFELAWWFAPSEVAVIRVGAELLQIAALFSVSDGVQAVSAGALRGIGDTKWPFYANAAGHWIVGLPVGLLLSEWLGLGVRGLWFGLTAGLTIVAIILTYRFWALTRSALHRVE